MASNNLKKRCVFLDRDGVINQSIIVNKKPFSPRTKSEFKFIPNIKNLISKIVELNFYTIIITNQPDIATAHLDEEMLKYFHDKIRRKIPITDIFVCRHISSQNCFCRKPKPGLILEAAKKYNIDLKKSYLIGDRWKDINAANEVGCHSIFIDYDYTEKLETKPNNHVKSMAEACDVFFKKERN
jgi:D-glycero-D-manno-heptose 1,7-bisphosphate phosphatase